MAVPGFQEFTLPLLRSLKDGSEQRVSDLVDIVASELSLSDEDRAELLPSGTQTKAENRTYWAGTYLVEAGLLLRPRRGSLQITDRGRKVLAQNPVRIDIAFLNQFPEFVEFKNRRGRTAAESRVSTTDVEEQEADETPDEALIRSYQNLRSALAAELLSRVKTCPPRFFERLVVDLLVAMGYGGSRQDAAQVVGQSGDGGIDGIIKEDRLGLDVVYVQAKRWDGPVNDSIVRNFAGSLDGHRAVKGVLITTSHFTQKAEEYVRVIPKKIVLIDGERLSDFMIDFDIGVSPRATYVVKNIDADYFGEV